MDIIQFKEANCKSCYKCIRSCDVKAISFQDNQARIIEDACVLCGTCTTVCPQNAKHMRSDLRDIKKHIANGTKVFVSLAPSYVASFPGATFPQVSAALKKLGFSRVEETAIGATEVSKEYARLIAEKKMRNIITTCCPTSIMLIEKYYPEALCDLAPVVSPAIAHAKMLKEIHGNRIKVVFVGPCISKKQEAQQGNTINGVLTFDELHEWMQEKGVSIQEEDQEPAEMHTTLSRLYPAPGGILSTIPMEKRRAYKSISVDGLPRCMEILESIRDHNISGYFIEMSACAGSCSKGPGLQHAPTPFLLTRDQILKNVRKKTDTPPVVTEHTQLDFSASYHETKIKGDLPSEATIKAILAKIGKTTPESMLNCGTCGYPTCRDKAIAVFQGKADLHMCLPYMREKAESMSNVILENTPNGLMLLDNEYSVIQFNRAAQEMLELTNEDTLGLPVEMHLEGALFDEVRESGKPLYHREQILLDGALYVSQSIVPIENGDSLVILQDITEEKASQKGLDDLRRETAEIAQKVIDKQMRVAQEIASLLGETTGETKAALTNLKKSLLK